MDNSNKKEAISPALNKVKKRLLILSPTVAAGLERECTKSDFFREGDKAIGKGGFGEVWKVIHKSTNKLYVIKVIDRKNIVEQKMIEQMNREIEIMYKVNHPHVIKLINHFEDDDKFYLVMLFASKGQLYSLLKRQNRFDQRTAAQYIRETLEAVRYLHSFEPPIIHRDIKPENLLLDENGRIKLADFGWSNFKSTDEARKTYCGTPEYLSPEMVKKQEHDTSVDIWSIGVLLFELLAGHAPFSGSNQEELFNNIRKLKINWPNDFPPLAKNLITKILKINPKERITIDEILTHSWFEKNTPLKPVLTVTLTDPAAILSSHLLNVNPDNVSEQITELVNVDKKMKLSISKSRQQTYQPNQDFKNTIDTLQIENNKLHKENSEWKAKFEKLESEFKSHKVENLKLKDLSQSPNLQNEIIKLNDELEKYKIINKDRLDLLTEIEERNNETFDYKNKIKNLEGEYNNLTRNYNTLNEKLSDQIKMNEFRENKINELKSKLNENIKEKEDMTINYQKKLEILQNKLLDNTCDNLDESKSETLTSVMEMLNDSINDMKSLFKTKMSSLIDLLNDRKEENVKSELNMWNVIKEKSEMVMEVLNKLKNSLEDDITKAKVNIQKEIPSKNSEMIEWLKRQISELQPYKNKVMFLDNKTAQFESSVQILQNKLDLANLNVVNLEKLMQMKDSKKEELRTYTENLEAKLSDVKDFVFKNCSDKLDEFNSNFKNY